MAEPEGRAVGDIADIKYLTRCLAFEPLNLLIHQSYAEDRGFGDIADIKYNCQYLIRFFWTSSWTFSIRKSCADHMRTMPFTAIKQSTSKHPQCKPIAHAKYVTFPWLLFSWFNLSLPVPTCPSSPDLLHPSPNCTAPFRFVPSRSDLPQSVPICPTLFRLAPLSRNIMLVTARVRC